MLPAADTLFATAAAVLATVEQGQSLSQCLPPALQRVPPEQRARLQALCYGSCRWFHRLDDELNQRLRRPLRRQDRIVHHLMLVALFQLRFSEQARYAVINESVEACRQLGKPHLSGLVNGVLRSAEREGPPEPGNDSARYSHPAWMLDKLRHNWPEHWQAIVEANNMQAPMTLRVNARHHTRAAYLEILEQAGIEARPTRFARMGIQLARALPVEQLPGFADGWVSVQDEAAQLCTDLLAPGAGQRLLDACAAPGGKTCAILEACPELSEVVAIDESAERLPRIRENLERLHLDATLIRADAACPDSWWDGRPFDRILLDVPCSATGVIRRHPDIKLLRRETDITPLAATQLELLTTMWTLLAPGGRLVYATCSVFPQENHRIIQRFRKQCPEARLLPAAQPWGLDTGAGLQLLPDPDSHDGFFYAVMEKPQP